MSETRTTVPKPFCFVLMPFSEEFDDVYQLGIKESCKKAGAYCERVDEQIFQETILERIYNQIAKADFIIADMTGRNANVFYEVGYAHALGKPTILLTQNADDIPFDLKALPHIVYEKKITALREDLTKRVKWFIENPGEKARGARLDVQVFVDGKDVSRGDAVHEYRPADGAHPNLVVHNASSRTLGSGSFQIGLLHRLFAFTEGTADFCELPDGMFLYMLPDFPALLPEAFSTYQVRLMWDISAGVDIQEKTVVRIFGPGGKQDYPLLLRRIE